MYTREGYLAVYQEGIPSSVPGRTYTEVYIQGGKCTYRGVHTGRCTYREVYLRGRCTYREVYLWKGLP